MLEKIKSIIKKKKKKNKGYPEKCPFCKGKQLAKGWARFSDRKLEKGKKKNTLVLLTTEAEREWYDFIVCFDCFRIIWYQLDPHGESEGKISLPTIQKLTGWQKIPTSPIVFYDDKGNPVYGTKRSQEIYG